MGWQYMTHPDLGSGALFPDSPDVVAVQEAKGWEVAELPVDLDPNAINEGTTVELAVAEGEVADLKGPALIQALEDAGLPKKGTADEKRARLAEHEASNPEADAAKNESE